jgi:hypothetical protein
MFIIDEDCRESIKNSQIDQNEERDEMTKFYNDFPNKPSGNNKFFQLKTSKSN